MSANKNPEFARAMAGAFVREVFKPKAETGQAPKEKAAAVESEYGREAFVKRSADEQAELFFELHSLVAEKRDLVQSLIVERRNRRGKEVEAIPDKVIRLPGGRCIVITAPDESALSAKEKPSVQQAKARIKEIERQLETLGRVPGLSEAYEKKIMGAYFIMHAAQEAEAMQDSNVVLDGLIQDIRARAAAGSAGAVRGLERLKIQGLEKERKENSTAIESVENHPVGRFLKLREYAQAFENGQLVEFPSAKQVIDEGLTHLDAHQPFLLAGHLGSGKTELAKHIARLHMIKNGVEMDGKENLTPAELYESMRPEIFSGGEEASVYDLVGKLKLTAKESADPALLEQRVDEFLAKFSAAQKERATAGLPSSLALTRKQVAEHLLGKAAVTETDFDYGPLGRALKRGVPLIIDEINMIPPEVISRINDILLRGVGSPVTLQENGEEPLEVKPGFGVLATCNLGVQYSGIRQVNAAFKSRWISKEVGYPEAEETFDLVLAALLRKDRVRLPPEFPTEQYPKLTDLTLAVHEIQNIFAGKLEGRRFMALAGKVAAEKAQLKESVVSTRDLMKKIVLPWKESGFKDLDQVIARNILGAEVFSVDDQKFMTEIFMRRGFFALWDAKQLAKAGIKGVTEAEIKALQVAVSAKDFKDPLSDLADAAHKQASLVRDELLVGTQKPVKK